MIAISNLVLYAEDSLTAFRRLRRRGTPREFGAASPRDFKTAKEPRKTIGSNHVLGERRKEKFLILQRMKNRILLISCLVILAIISFWYFSFFKKPASFTQNEPALNKSGARHELLAINWGSADTIWKTFAEQHIEKMRQAEAKTPASKLPGYKFDRVFVEVKSLFISKFLPDYQIFTEKYVTYAFNTKTKSITNIANGWGGAVGDDPYYRNQEFSNFIKTQKIQVTDKQSAIEFLKLVEDMYRWSDSDNVTYWTLEANRDGATWIVRYKYIGPPENSIIIPPVWEIAVDKDNYIIEIRQQRERF